MLARILLHKSPQTITPVSPANGVESMESDNPLSVFILLTGGVPAGTIYGDSRSPVSR